VKILKQASEKVQQYCARYMTGLIGSKEKRTCTNIAKLFGVSHDTIYRFLCFTSAKLSPGTLVKLVGYFSEEEPGWLIIDDTSISKQFAQWIECLTRAYDTATCREIRSISIVVIVWSNGLVTVPLGFRYWYKKEQCEDEYKTKSKLAQELILECKNNDISFDYLLADGLYFSIEMARFLEHHKIKFEMRAHSNRSIKVNEFIEQLKRHPSLRLYRNQRKKTVKAEWHGLTLYFTVHKRKDKNGTYSIVFLVSNYIATPESHINRYEQRWEIEKMFRTMKQKLGLGHCSARKSNVHTQHIYAVFISYAFLQHEKKIRNLSNVETVISHLLDAKSMSLYNLIHSFNRNFQCFA